MNESSFVSDGAFAPLPAPEWRLAVQMLIDAAEDRGPMLFAKMGLQRAMNRNVQRVLKPSRTDHPHRGTPRAGARSITEADAGQHGWRTGDPATCLIKTAGSLAEKAALVA
jgi:hypothetical protein